MASEPAVAGGGSAAVWDVDAGFGSRSRPPLATATAMDLRPAPVALRLGAEIDKYTTVLTRLVAERTALQAQNAAAAEDNARMQARLLAPANVQHFVVPTKQVCATRREAVRSRSSSSTPLFSLLSFLPSP